MTIHSITMKTVAVLCMLIFSISFTSIVAEDVSPDGYHQLLGLSYYKFHGERAPSWDRARKVCIEEGGHLAVLNSEEEARVLSAMLAAANVSAGAATKDYAYIGFHDMFTEGDYVTILDQPLSSTGYTRWSAGEPNDDINPYSEDCGSIYMLDGGLNDLSCDASLAFICERA